MKDPLRGLARQKLQLLLILLLLTNLGAFLEVEEAACECVEEQPPLSRVAPSALSLLDGEVRFVELWAPGRSVDDFEWAVDDPAPWIVENWRLTSQGDRRRLELTAFDPFEFLQTEKTTLRVTAQPLWDSNIEPWPRFITVTALVPELHGFRANFAIRGEPKRYARAWHGGYRIVGGGLVGTPGEANEISVEPHPRLRRKRSLPTSLADHIELEVFECEQGGQWVKPEQGDLACRNASAMRITAKGDPGAMVADLVGDPLDLCDERHGSRCYVDFTFSVFALVGQRRLELVTDLVVYVDLGQ